MCAVPLPKGGSLISVQGELHMVGEESQDTAKFAAYGLSGHMVPVPEPESAVGFGALWDNVIVKAADPSVAAATTKLDFDWDTADTGTEIEPGEVDLLALLGLTQTKEILPPRMEWVSWAKSRQGGFIAGTPDVYLPSDFKTFRSKRRLTAEVPSALMLAVSSPVLDDLRELAAHVTPSSAGEWYMMANMEETLRDFGKGNAGLTEAGALAPYLNASNLIAELVAPPMLDESSTQYNSMSWQALMVCTWILEYPDESIPNTLDGR